MGASIWLEDRQRNPMQCVDGRGGKGIGTHDVPKANTRAANSCLNLNSLN